MFKFEQTAHLLPVSAVKALQETAQLDSSAPVGESNTRNRALDTVIARIKLAHPQFFQREDMPNTRFK